MGGLSRRGARGCGKGLKIDIFALMTHTGTAAVSLISSTLERPLLASTPLETFNFQVNMLIVDDNRETFYGK